jgi:hypothetical protein
MTGKPAGTEVEADGMGLPEPLLLTEPAGVAVAAAPSLPVAVAAGPPQATSKTRSAAVVPAWSARTRRREADGGGIKDPPAGDWRPASRPAAQIGLFVSR